MKGRRWRARVPACVPGAAALALAFGILACGSPEESAKTEVGASGDSARSAAGTEGAAAGGAENSATGGAGTVASAPPTHSDSRSGEPAHPSPSAGVSTSPGSRELDPRTLVYVCDSLRVVARTDTAGLHLFLPGGYERLDRVRSASGVRYESARALFWTKGDELLLEVDGHRYEVCERRRREEPWEDAKLRGADFRAAGNEPGWHLELRRGDRITLVTSYGADTIQVPTPDPEVDEKTGRAVYRSVTEAHALELVIEPGGCTDDMSGEEFSARVEVVVNGRRLQGCGRPLH